MMTDQLSHKVSEAEIFRYIEADVFPTNKERLENIASQHNATDDVLKALHELPNREFINAEDLSSEIEKL